MCALSAVGTRLGAPFFKKQKSGLLITFCWPGGGEHRVRNPSRSGGGESVIYLQVLRNYDRQSNNNNNNNNNNNTVQTQTHSSLADF